ncbi:protein sidekick-2-like [Lates japonicus]
MFPAWRRGRRTGSSTVAPRTMDTAGRTGQVGQVWVSCWILLSATCILSARAQGKIRNSDFFPPLITQCIYCCCWRRLEKRTRKSVIGMFTSK